MTRYVVIALINVLIIGLIAVNGAIALLRGCSIGAGCGDSSSTLTWALVIGATIAAVAAIVVLAKAFADRRRAMASQNITITSIGRGFGLKRNAAETEPADDAAGEAMLMRLARMSRHAPVADEGAATPAETPAPVSLAKTADVAPVEAAQPDLRLVVDRGERLARRPLAPVDHAPDAPITSAAAEGRFDWLMDEENIHQNSILRIDSGFPWCFAGLDHVCAELSRPQSLPSESAIALEIAAWRQIAASLPREDRLSLDDAAAFVGWLNGALHSTGTDGHALLEQVAEQLASEAATDPAVARCLPRDFWTGGLMPSIPLARFG